MGPAGHGARGADGLLRDHFSGSVTARNDRPDWLVTISNDAWYGNSAGPVSISRPDGCEPWKRASGRFRQQYRHFRHL